MSGTVCFREPCGQPQRSLGDQGGLWSFLILILSDSISVQARSSWQQIEIICPTVHGCLWRLVLLGPSADRSSLLVSKQKHSQTFIEVGGSLTYIQKEKAWGGNPQTRNCVTIVWLTDGVTSRTWQQVWASVLLCPLYVTLLSPDNTPRGGFDLHFTEQDVIAGEVPCSNISHYCRESLL